MLNRLYEIGKKHYFMEEKAIKDIPKSCCKNEKCLVIDFDKLKEKIVKKHNLQTVSSCDGLKICIENDLIEFIELKSIKKFIENQKKLTKEKIDRQIKRFDFEKKIEDSLFLLNVLLRSNTSDLKKEDLEKFKDIKKRYFVVTDLELENNPLYNLDFTLKFLSEYPPYQSYIKICIENKLNKIELCFLIEKPRLLSCKDICKILCKI